MEKTYRRLTDQEVGRLLEQGCTADRWEKITVGDGFDPAYLRDSHLGGDIRIGATGGDILFPGGIVKKAGVYHAALYNCTLGDNVLVSRIGSHIGNYDIGEGTVIENVGTLACEGLSTFGNGVEVSVINEAGGREVPIYDHLTAQIAYIIAMYRHRPETVRRLGEMIRSYARSVASERGTIGRECRITNSTTITNVRMGDCVTVDSISSLRNGTINSTAESPSRIGTEVIASDFIMARSSTVDTGSLLKRCFVGEGTMIENGYSAENSLFFANCHCNHGEACSVFAGPYTVTHHRATLLIAGYYSFFNAGSGANQSNHMYKSGPVHQGVHLRGCKFGSDAYILLPARTGAFTLVTGRHYSHYDTLEMPFSYLVDEEGESYLVPGANIRSFGTARDIKKWPRRDKRAGVASDILHFGMMTPYTANNVLRGIEIAQILLAKYPTAEVYAWNRVKIKSASLKKGLILYRQAMHAYLADLLEAREKRGGDKFARQQQGREKEYARWVDLAGMIAPRCEIVRVLDDVDAGRIASPEALTRELRSIDDRYETYADLWSDYALSVLLGKKTAAITGEDIAALVEEAEAARQTLRAAVEKDAGRDVAPLMAIGYGIDSDDPQERSADFDAVRGL